MTVLDPRQMLRIATFGAYDLQKLRIQIGLRLCANFRAKLKDKEKADQLQYEIDESERKEELSKEAESVLDQLRASYKRLTDGIARNRTLPTRAGFKGDELISDHTELILVHQYITIEKAEQSAFHQLENLLDLIPIYTEYLKNERGVGPAMAAVLISYFDPHQTRYVSNFWSYAGLDVAPDGFGRSRRAEHLVDREYTTRDGRVLTKKSTTYNPKLKSRLMGVLAKSFLRSGSRWTACYYNYKNRINSDTNRLKLTSEQYKALHLQDEEAAKHSWPPLRIHNAAMRYMIKMFLIEFWKRWRELEGLEVTPTYQEAKLGHVHGGSRTAPEGDQPQVP